MVSGWDTEVKRDSYVQTETIPLLHKSGWHSNNNRLEHIRSGYSIFHSQLRMSVAVIKAKYWRLHGQSALSSAE